MEACHWKMAQFFTQLTANDTLTAKKAARQGILFIFIGYFFVHHHHKIQSVSMCRDTLRCVLYSYYHFSNHTELCFLTTVMSNKRKVLQETKPHKKKEITPPKELEYYTTHPFELANLSCHLLIFWYLLVTWIRCLFQKEKQNFVGSLTRTKFTFSFLAFLFIYSHFFLFFFSFRFRFNKNK